MVLYFYVICIVIYHVSCCTIVIMLINCVVYGRTSCKTALGWWVILVKYVLIKKIKRMRIKTLGPSDAYMCHPTRPPMLGQWTWHPVYDDKKITVSWYIDIIIAQGLSKYKKSFNVNDTNSNVYSVVENVYENIGWYGIHKSIWTSHPHCYHYQEHHIVS